MAVGPRGPSGLTSYFPRGAYLTFPKRQNVPYSRVEQPPDPSLTFSDCGLCQVWEARGVRK